MPDFVMNIWTTMRSAQLFPEVIILCLGVYFIAKDLMGVDPKWSPVAPMAISILGQMGLAWPTSPQYVLQDITMALVNAVIAVGVYSASDKYGLVEKLAKRLGRKIDDSAIPGDTKP